MNPSEVVKWSGFIARGFGKDDANEVMNGRVACWVESGGCLASPPPPRSIPPVKYVSPKGRSNGEEEEDSPLAKLKGEV